MIARPGHSKPVPTTFDYVLIGLNPLLIMLMVGSLAFFLVTAAYHGEFEIRLMFILALFVMAIVLIARISIESGFEYASLFAIPLAVVMMMAVGRFTNLSVFAAGLVFGILWWSAHRLTWDCTVIQESEELTGRGLLETAGLNERSESNDDAARDLEATTRDGESADDEDAPRSWWAKFVARQHKPHAHGVWVIYFALAALPLFGFGQALVEAPDARKFVLKLFWVYMASAFGLLMTTSLLSLRMYLRRRRFAMPDEMTTVWLATGSAMVAAVLIACLILPRPIPEYSITSLWKVESPITMRVNNYGPFEGRQQKNARQTAAARAQSQPQGQQEQRQQKQGQQQQGQQQGQQQQGQQQQGQQQQGQQKPGQQQQGQQQQRGQQQEQGRQQQGQQQQQGQGQQQQPQEQQRQEQRQGQQQQRQQSQQQQGQEQRNPRPQQAQEGQQRQPSEQATQSQQRQQQSADQRPADARVAQQQQQSAADRASQRETSRSRFARSSQSPSTNRSPSSPSPAQPQAPSIGQIFVGLSRMLTWLYYLAFIAIAAWLLWKNWQHVARAFRELLTNLQNLLSSLFGWNGRRQQPLVASDTAPAKPRVPSFASFTNPFATGAAQQASLKELVTYTFRALEAWSQDRGRPRGDEQTPLEFAHMVASAEPDLGADAKDVCELYCRLAYGNGQLPRQSRDVLERFWQELESAGRA